MTSRKEEDHLVRDALEVSEVTGTVDETWSTLYE